MNKSMRKYLWITLFVLSIGDSLSEGTPGAEWARGEKLMTRKRIRAIFDDPQMAADEFKTIRPEAEYEYHGDVVPDAAKMLRLGFHDCFPYKDEPGEGFANGCDGCLNPEGMGLNLEEEWRDEDGQVRAPKVLWESSNNGLWWTADMLEMIFTNNSFPSSVANDMKNSLKEKGKSRADLWAFAALIAVEYSINEQNNACDGRTKHSCGHLKQLDADCKFNFPRDFKFRSGRKDCQANEKSSLRGFFTSRSEEYPRIHATGVETLQYYKEKFGLDPDLAIALHGGAHSLGEFHDTVSLLKYTWTRHQVHLLNNQFFKTMAGRPSYHFSCRGFNHSARILGNQFGEPAETSWAVINARRTHDNIGGPFQFFQRYHKCKGNCGDILYPIDYWQSNEYCMNRPPGIRCNDMDNLDNQREAAILADIGLYLDFQVDPTNGAPIGCDGLDYHRGGDTFILYPHCGKAESAPIVDKYADDQDLWVATFFDAIEAMISNGYKKPELIKTKGPVIDLSANGV